MGRQIDEIDFARIGALRKNREVVLMHDWLTGFRGGEWILEALGEIFPESDLYTLIHIPGSTTATIESRTIHTSFLNRIPGIERHYRKFLPFFPLAARSLHLRRDVETVVSSSHCVIKGVRKPHGAYHLSYVHSPMRYMYDQFDSYFGAESGAPLYQRWAAQICRPYLTSWDRHSNDEVDLLVANSNFVRERIRKYYGRDSKVVHPFVELSDFNRRYPKDDFYLMVTAFAPNKRVDLAVQAFNDLGLPLKVIGDGQDNARLRSLAKSNIEFLGGGIARADVISHMSRARAFIFPGVEDFGITPLESLAAGTPVIAFRAGGVLETLTPSDTEFFDSPDKMSLIKAIKKFDERDKQGDFFIDGTRLAAFSRARFKSQILELLEAKERL
jgi:glycosyltransferase involved in cell wall biosynthesis